MKKIWRVQNSHGVGCYQGCPNGFIKGLSDEPTPNKPLPQHDKGIGRCIKKEKEICGFKDEEQAKRWFDKKMLKILKSYGYNLECVAVKEVTAMGEYQVLAVPLKSIDSEYVYCDGDCDDWDMEWN